MTNKNNTTLYTGITSDLRRRVFEHKNNVKEGFTSRYKVHKLVYYEVTNDKKAAYFRERRIKTGSRRKKIALINNMNPEWIDLSDSI